MPRDVSVLVDEVVSAIDGAIVPVLERLAAADARIADLTARLADVGGLADGLTATLAALRERLAAIEVTAAIPGPAGLDGLTGPPGPPGPPGPDGLGFTDAGVLYDGERTVTIRFSRDAQAKDFPIVVPWLLHRGTFVAGTLYDRGDVVTAGGSSWHACEPTRHKPGEHPSWQLIVQRGKAGRNADREVR